MIWTQAVFALIIGLVVISFQNVNAEDILPMKGSSSTGGKPGNKNNLMVAPLADNYLYTLFACRNKQNGLRLPIAGSCVDYFECNEGRTVRKTCDDGFQFSNHGLTCLDARLSKCRPEQKVIPCEGPCCTREDGLYPAEDSCANFYICISGHSYHRTCGSILQFDASNLICDIPERARCSTKVEKEVEQEESEEVVVKGEEVANSRPALYRISHRVCKSKPNGYSVPIPGSCNKFYMCIAGLGYLKSCGRMQFNPAKHYCDLRTRMYCPDDDEDEVILDDDQYLLTDAKPRPQTGTKPWNPEESSEDDGEVQSVPSKKPQKKEKPIRGEKDKQESLDGKKPKPVTEDKGESLEKVVKKNTSKFDRKPSKRPQIPDETEDAEEDESAELVRPGARPSHSKPSEKEEIVGKNTAAATKTNVCSDQPVGALLALPGECGKYIRCRWDWYERRTGEVLACPDDMHFNPKTKYCDWPENVNCKTKSDEKSRPIKKTKKPQKGF